MSRLLFVHALQRATGGKFALIQPACVGSAADLSLCPNQVLSSFLSVGYIFVQISGLRKAIALIVADIARWCCR